MKDFLIILISLFILFWLWIILWIFQGRYCQEVQSRHPDKEIINSFTGGCEYYLEKEKKWLQAP